MPILDFSSLPKSSGHSNSRQFHQRGKGRQGVTIPSQLTRGEKRAETEPVAAPPKLLRNDPPVRIPAIRMPSNPSVLKSQPLQFSGVFRAHELTRKDRRLSSGLAPLDDLLDGGVPRGRISEITGRAGSGNTSLAPSFAASATHRGEVAAWLDGSGAFDPERMAAAGVALPRILWAKQ